MKKILRLLVVAIFISLTLGQLTRLTLSAQLAFYFHDFFILLFLCLVFCYQLYFYCRRYFFHFSSSSLKSLFSSPIRFFSHSSPSRSRAVAFLFCGLIFLLLASSCVSLPSLLYALRFFTYLSFFFLLWRLQLFTAVQYRQLLFVFFFTFALLGLSQYFFFPDTRFLENLGWDDHYFRLIGTWFDPAFTALALVFGLIYGFFFFRRERAPFSFFSSRHFTFFHFRTSLSTIFVYTYFSFLSLALVFTYSRSSFLALALVSIIYFFSRIRFKPSASSDKKHLSSPSKSLLRKFLLALIFFISIFFFFIFTAWRIPSDSTNLLRTNSIDVRLDVFRRQLQQFTPEVWLRGRGFFVSDSLSSDFNSTSSIFSILSGSKKAPIYQSNFNNSISEIAPDAKKTVAFPDNFFLLLFSFFGLPFTLILLVLLFYFLLFAWRQCPPLFYLSLALLIVAQFNQAVFQPFIILLFGFLVISLRPCLTKNAR